MVYYNNKDSIKIQLMYNIKILHNNKLILIQVNLGQKWIIFNYNYLMVEMLIIQILINVVNHKKETNEEKGNNKSNNMHKH